MKSFTVAALAALCAQNVAAHATFQQLWVDGTDYGSQCARVPSSNSPVTDVSSNNFRCNSGTSRPSGKCPVKAGSTVAVEMHQQNGDRSCSNEAIGGAHYGPVLVYMSKVSDAATADGSSGWFKVFQDTWAKKSGSGSGDDDFWGTKDLNTCCGKMNVKIPADLPSGDYLLRAEVIALHAASSGGGAQFYMTCYQLSVTGSGSASPATVSFPGAYKASDPGIAVSIHSSMSGYTAPGPAVYSGGSSKVAGSACSGCESTCKVGSGSTPTLSQPTSSATSTPAPGGGGNNGGCEAAKYQQCGGTGYTGCTNCASGSTCSAVSPPYYSQCI
ncbi:glycosyl hydrolase family 61-domain-containing protein [Chaetomidium leptoderma]|uniref:lytic cellulose monooxygenase (C4-dehydrogenating) n=1 Tax=Chaetomidium leptoderma TaxID=669021 RepID=A0AAN6ZXA5_9PEZI|nr:glycosyl hydrolase family 61-domain-containing protein [Chaetomidium leptoderma]